MSQHIVKIDQRTEAQIGWDPPLNTFYGQVYHIDGDGERIDVFVEDDEEKDGTIFWIGGMPPQVQNVDDLARQLLPHLELSDELRRELEADRRANR